MKNDTVSKNRSYDAGSDINDINQTTCPPESESYATPDGPCLHLLPSLLLGLFTLAAMALVTHFDIDRFSIELSDETGYLTAGLERLDQPSTWNIYSFPVHILTYSFTGLFEADPVRNYKLNAFVPFYIMVFLLQLHVYRQTSSALLAVVSVAPLLLASEMGLLAWTHSNQTVCIVFLIGMLLTPRKAHLVHVACYMTVIFFLIGFARAEQILNLYLMLLLAGAWALLWFIKCRNWRSWRQKFAWPIFLVISLIAGLSATFDKPVLLDKYRSQVAFYQHFAYGLWLRTDDAADPFTESERVFEEHFGDATSISSALFNNPAAFFDHLLGNLQYFFAWGINSDPVGALAWLVALAIYLYCLWQLGRRVLFQWRSNVGQDTDLWRTTIGIAPIPTLLLLALIFPRTNYLQMSYVLLVATSIVIIDIPGTLSRFGGAVSQGFAAASAVGVLAVLSPLPQKLDPFIDVVNVISRDALSQKRAEIQIASTRNFCVFVELPCRERLLKYSMEEFTEVVRGGEISYVVAFKDPSRPDHGEDLDAYFSQLTASSDDPLDWRTLDVPIGWTVLRRKGQ